MKKKSRLQVTEITEATHLPAAETPSEGLGLSATLDLFLNEENLIRLAQAHLKGALPPTMRSREKRAHSEPTLNSLRPKSLLARELAARGWTPRDLAQETGLPEPECVALAKGNARMRPEVARILAECFATSEEFWT